ncbi:MAG: Hpt domain-containing protein [Oscillospiraceae bacterium]|nr:Hpt domain-containing protein [Oscillospiraceae bacterium]
MTLKEFYKAVGGSYKETLRRLMNDTLIKQYLRMFSEAGDLEKLLRALEAGQWEDAFRHVHNLKGVCLNLGLGRLAEASSELCEALRSGEPTVDITPLTAEVKEAGAQILENLESLE